MAQRRSINPPLNIYKKIAITFIAITMILIAFIFYFAMNFAYITVVPQSDPITSEFNVVVVRDSSQADLAQGIFSGSVISEEVSGSGTFEAKSVKVVQANGEGRARIINNYSQDQPLGQ